METERGSEYFHLSDVTNNKKELSMSKRGVTLVEIMVSMGLFAVLASIIVGAFVMTLNMKTLVTNMKESQQKTRMALEILSRLARQANRVEVFDLAAGGGVRSQGNAAVF
jgi:prepilin-type N-terminal cleavage/methylation domain-containing protein